MERGNDNMSLVLQTNCLTKKFGKQIAVNKVSIHIEKGDIYGFIGKNGAGKTTLMKMVSGLIYQNQGEIRLFGSSDVVKGRRRIGCVIEQPALYPGMTARENLIYYDKLLGIADYQNVDVILKLVGLENTGKKKTKNFSLGMKQRLSIGISLLGSPDFLILDEPINGLDPAGIKEVRELLLKLNSENEITILISSHILGELAKIATRYGIIEGGVLVDELDAMELEERCKKYLSIIVNDTEKAAYILKNRSTDFKVFEHGKICVYDCLDMASQINKELVESDVLVSSISLEGHDIEAYFVKMMGGEQ
jgi:ABC-2 type transport system ATP-binding protein